jgi:hypothetical protein
MGRQMRQLITTAHKQVASSKLAHEQSEKKIARTQILIERSNVRIAKNLVRVQASRPQEGPSPKLTPLTLALIKRNGFPD